MSTKHKKTLTYKGETAKVSLMAWKHKVSPRTILARMKRGWSDVECIEGKEGRKNTRDPTIVLTYEGMEGTLKQWAVKTGTSLHTITSRHRRGWSVEQILKGK